MSATAAPFSDDEYFTVLLAAAVQSRDAGDYGLGAALSVRVGNAELISVGRNAVISARDPLGHAEVNAIRGLQAALARQRSGQTQHARRWRTLATAVGGPVDGVYFRPYPSERYSGRVESLLYTSLEPCPMCTVALLTAHVGRVVIAAPDEPGGALAPGRLAKLPPIWPSLAAEAGIVVDFADPGSRAASIRPDLAAQLRHVFWETKEALDAEVSGGALLSRDVLTEISRLASGQDDESR